MDPMTPSSRHGFSLTELLVVIAIIAGLAALLVPAISAVRSSAQTLTCANNLRSAGIAFESLAQDDHGLLPWGNFGPSPGPFSWPSAIKTINNEFKQTCPAVKNRAGSLHYTGNMQVLANRNPVFGSSAAVKRRVNTAELSANVVMIFDGGLSGSGNTFPMSENMGLTFYFLNRSGLSATLQDDANVAPAASGTFAIDKRHGHGKRANFLFSDGHVQTLEPTSLLNRDFRINANGRFYY
jgi:prepilin-type N-terminal cleavage/methylation domain-containing protein/prepilin-type processing-associated H-X9-DG protein